MLVYDLGRDEDKMPVPIFVRLRCEPCGLTFSARRDPMTGNLFYHEGHCVPDWPPSYVVAGGKAEYCPKCLAKMEIVSAASVVTRDGRWLRLDGRSTTFRRG